MSCHAVTRSAHLGFVRTRLFRRRRVFGWLALLLSVGVALFTAGVLWPLKAPPPPPGVESFAVRNVTVVDTEGELDLPNATVLVRDGRIEAVGPAEKMQLPEGVRLVEGQGRFLIPGLWDMHAHVIREAEQLQLPLYVAHGVTGLRDMLSWPDDSEIQALTVAAKRDIHARVERGALAGPRIVSVASYYAEGPSPRNAGFPSFFNVSTPDEARAFVAHEKAHGADFIKMYNRTPREAYFALLKEARRLELPVAGHVPYTVSLREAVEAGQRSIEHGRDLLYACFPEADRFRAAMLARESRVHWLQQMVDQHESERCDALFETLREHDTFLCPTHVIRREDALADDVAYRQDPHLGSLHWLYRIFWRFDLDDTVAEDPSPAGRQAYRAFYRKGLELTGRAHRAGVKVLAGTDHPFYGASLHQELEELVEAGLSPREALRAATLHPALFLGRAGDYGSIRPGKRADLVLVDGNPLESIQAVRRISLVSVGGRLYERESLDRLLTFTQEQAGSWSLGCKILWRVLRSLLP
jgi:imidazolonepropionase-like amidohydrolase